ncbi:MAG: oligosaccharide flippase family protein [Armatimonadota bacterium]
MAVDSLQSEQPLTTGLSLRKNFSWTFAGNVVYAASQWAMLMLIAKFGNPKMVGQFSLGLALTAPIFMFTNLQLRSIQATDARGNYSFNIYLGLRLLMSCLALILVIGITLVSSYHLDVMLVVVTIGAAKFVESISDIFQGLFQLHERMNLIAIAQMIKGPLSVVFLACGIYYTKSILFGSLGLLLAWLSVLVFYELRVSRIIKKQVNITSICPLWIPTKLTQLAVIALPLGIVTMLVSLNANIPRYTIERFMGQRELGIYAAMAYSMVAGLTVSGALGQSAAPRLARYYVAADMSAFMHLLIRLVIVFIVFGALGVLLAACFGKELLTVLYTPEYAEHTEVFTIMAIASAISFTGSIFIYALTAARCLVNQIPLYLLATAATCILSFYLIPRYGLAGAAYALCCSSVILLLGAIFYMSKVVLRIKSTKLS